MVQKAVDILIGETGSGKTSYISELFKNDTFEVINCDSRQIYRHLNIGTAKPPASMLDKIKHHFVDIVDITENYDVMDFVNHTTELLEGDGKYIISAGTPFYLNILLNGISPIPKVSDNVREDVRNQLNESGIQAMYEELVKRDPQRASEIKPNDSQRIIRALEVIRETDKPISFYFKTVIKPDIVPNRITYIRRDRDELRKRVEHRTHMMIESGLIDETRSIIEKYGIDILLEKKIIGYTEAVMHIRGAVSLSEAEEMIVKNTMSYIKHQRTFFNKIIKPFRAVCLLL